MSKLEFGTCQDKLKWDAFVRESPHGSIFCQSRFLDVLTDEYQLMVIEEDGRIAAGVVLMLRDGVPLPAPYTLTMYQGVLLGVGYAHMPAHKRCPWQLERMEALLAGVTAQHPSFSVCLSPYFDDIRAFQWFHYHTPALGTFAVTVAYTGLLRLDVLGSFEAFLTQIRTVRRQEYRRGLERGFSADSSSDIELLDRLHAATFMRQGVERSPEQRTLLRRIAAAALQGGFGELLVCHLPDGRPASATLFLHDDRCAYYLVGANEPEYRNTGSGTFLLVENIRRALSRGLTAVDFVGINSPQRGDFKTSFNAQPSPYYVLSYRGLAADTSPV